MATLDTNERSALADKGEAERDGSFPIRNRVDLENAIRDWGRAGAKASDKAWIIHRAHALGLSDALPQDWTAHVKEAQLTAFMSPVTLMESAGADIAPRILLIAACTSNGVTGRMRYSTDLLEREASKFDNLDVFDNHRTDREEQEKPYRSIREHLGRISGVHFESVARAGAPEGGLVGTLTCFDPTFEQRIRQHPESVKFSIRAEAMTKPVDEKIREVLSFQRIHSLDAVIHAGAGGRVLSVREAEQQERTEDVETLLHDATTEQLVGALRIREASYVSAHQSDNSYLGDEKEIGRWKGKMAGAKQNSDRDLHDRLLDNIPMGTHHDRLECHLCRNMSPSTAEGQRASGAIVTAREAEMTGMTAEASAAAQGLAQEIEALKAQITDLRETVRTESYRATSGEQLIQRLIEGSGLPTHAKQVLAAEIRESAYPTKDDELTAFVNRRVERYKSLLFQPGQRSAVTGQGDARPIPVTNRIDKIREQLAELVTDGSAPKSAEERKAELRAQQPETAATAK